MNIRHTAIVALSIIGLAVLIGLALNSVNATIQQEVPELVAQYVTSSLQVDGVADDAAWGAAPAATLLGGVTLKAVYDATTLSVLATWPDGTLSMTQGGSWTWDGSVWSTDPSSGQNEDRLAISWNINASGFAAQGCMVACHGGSMYLETAGERADMWHMKAARSLGVLSAAQAGALTVDPTTHEVTAGSVALNGYVDDKYLAQDGGEDAGRYGDAGRSTYARNRNTEQTGPLYIERDPADYIDAMILRQEEVDGGEVLVVVDATASEISAAWDRYTALDAVVPERVLRTPEGSRGDVLQSATWANGVWTAEYQRALVTGNDDDVQLDDLSKTYYFGVAVFDNSGGVAHDFTNLPNKLTFGEGPTAVSQTSWGALKKKMTK